MEFGLIMPFVVVRSVDGPYDDESYVAGWEMGKLAHTLAATDGQWVATSIHRANLPQADLVAMDAGFTMTDDSEQVEDADAFGDWAFVTFNRIAVADRATV